MIAHTVLMPYSRPKNFNTLREHMEGQGVTWVPLYDSDECHALFAAKNEFGLPAPLAGPLPDWIKPWRGDLPKEKIQEHPGGPVTYRPTVNPGHWMCDAYLDEQVKHDETYEGFSGPGCEKFFRKDHYVSFMTDDTLWNWNFWRKLQRHFVKRNKGGGEVHPAVIMCSTTTPNGGFVAPGYNRDWPQNASRTFATRFECMTVRADKLRDVRFGSFWAGDGIVVERLVEENWEQGEVEFAPECVVYWNGLSPEAYGFPATHQR